MPQPHPARARRRPQRRAVGVEPPGARLGRLPRRGRTAVLLPSRQVGADQRRAGIPGRSRTARVLPVDVPVGARRKRRRLLVAAVPAVGHPYSWSPPNGEPEPAPGAMVCEPCARLTIGDFLTRWGQRWHAVAPISERTPRDRLVSTLLDRLDGGVADLDAHARAMKEARAGPCPKCTALRRPSRCGSSTTGASARWPTGTRCRVDGSAAMSPSGRDGFFSETHWAEATAPAGSGAR